MEKMYQYLDEQTGHLRFDEVESEPKVEIESTYRKGKLVKRTANGINIPFPEGEERKEIIFPNFIPKW